ncbi:unnamed protein product [Ambrosiozyma monospora]|uniref:Unnamed protein product n=1 Tax=Ambrosiozyma monospora TaxID=43982 RepID=A0ACB5T437_AMBMO|nr:unnamed protein product [Ambrosiozyma monospora]
MSGQEDTMPAVCETCLGTNPYVEMIRERNGAECKTCTRPFTTFRWRPEKLNSGSGGSGVKRTMICLTCARSKNCCQSCMLDLTYGIDLTTRDQLLKLAGTKTLLNSDSIPKNEVAKRYVANQLDKKYSQLGQDGLKAENEERQKEAKVILSRISKMSEKKNQKLEDGNESGSKHNKKKRNEPEMKITKAELLRLCKNLPFNGNLIKNPNNPQIKTFFLFGLTDGTPTYLIKQYFTDLLEERSDSKKVETVFVNEKGRFGFIQFGTRSVAEDVASRILKLQKTPDYDRPCLILIDGKVPVRVCWSRSMNTSGSDFTNVELRKIAVR